MLDGLSQLKNEDINNKIKEFRSTHNLLVRQLTFPRENRTYNTDSLQTIVEKQEAFLVRKNTEINSKDKEFNWKKIKKNLQNNEIVIEFSNFNLRAKNQWTNDRIYVAYLFDNQSDYPEVIQLFEQQEIFEVLDQISPSSLYKLRGSEATSTRANSSEALYNMIWKPLEHKLQEKKTIYFAPSGTLNQIAMAALPNSKGETMISRFDLQQYSSTIKLVDRKKRLQQSPAILAGGIDYDYIARDTVELSELAEEPISLLIANDKRSNQNGVWKFLNGTATEINSLEKIYQSNRLNSKKITGKEATEEWFKSLHKNSPKVLHLATHGFFFEDNIDTTSTKSLQPHYTLSRDPLLRSGIILANANYAWQHNRSPSGTEDGILTALEISKLDLSNIDLVVLSACETGLGDITGSEGVYGLQRAFKMAGVKNIIMSLWDVPDKETSEYMKIFYNNWMENSDIRNAFINTQRIMAKKYKNEPENWAAFVLIE